MGDNFLELNANKRLHELSYGITVQLANAMRHNWEDVLKKIPNMPLSPFEVEQHFGKLEIQGKNPADAIFPILGRRGIRLDALKTCFEELNFEEGLRIIGYKPKLLQSKPLFPPEIRLQKGTRLELCCRTTGFPNPKHVYKKDGVNLFEGNPFVIENVDIEDSGIYNCVVTQGYTFYTFSTIVIVEDFQGPYNFAEKLKVDIQPPIVTYNVGTKIAEINATVNIRRKKLNYQWFKRGEKCANDEAIMNNPTAVTPTLVLKDITIDDAGKYTCQVSDGVQTVIGQACKLNVRSESQYDLKMALIIGNGDYMRYDCNVCENLDFSFSNLSVSSGLINLKHKLEQNDFIVMTYIDLEAENFLRVIRLFKEKCEAAKNVLAFIYIGAHGFHFGAHDFLVPVDIQNNLHSNHNMFNNADVCKQTLGLCSLANLLENFSNDNNSENSTKYSVICFWDLCRATNIDFPTDSYSIACRNLQYTIIYCCNVGSSAYEIKDWGSIMLNVFLEQFQDNRSLNDILVAVDKRIQKIKAENQKFEKVNKLKIHSTVGEKYILSLNANRSRDYRNLIDDLYFRSFNHKTQLDIRSQTGKYFRFYYQFIRDEFLNAILLDVQQEKTFYPVKVSSPSTKIRIENPDERRNFYHYRIKGIQNLVDEDLFIDLCFFNKDYEVLKERITLPTNAFSIIRHLYSESINYYVSNKIEALKLMDISSISDTTDSEYGDNRAFAETPVENIGNYNYYYLDQRNNEESDQS